MPEGPSLFYRSTGEGYKNNLNFSEHSDKITYARHKKAAGPRWCEHLRPYAGVLGTHTTENRTALPLYPPFSIFGKCIFGSCVAKEMLCGEFLPRAAFFVLLAGGLPGAGPPVSRRKGIKTQEAKR